jgi:peptide subunit release factor 1 (eRF1)
MAVEARQQALPKVLAELRDELPPKDGVLSVYLDTSPARVIGQGHLLFLRDAYKAIRATLPKEDLEPFEAAATQIEAHLSSDVAATHAGLAVFGAAPPSYFRSVPLPAAPREEVVWDKHAHIAPLQAALDDFERFAVVLFDKERARLFTIYLGEIETELAVDDYVPGKQATGGWYGLAQARYARHHEDHVRRHVKHTIGTLMVLLRGRPFDRLFLAGPDEALSFLMRELPRPLRARFAGTIRLELFASSADVLHAALEAASVAERKTEAATVKELVEEGGRRFVVLGPAPTLEAITTGRVHKLLVANTYQGPGSECERCGQMTVEDATCPKCGQATTAVLDLRERAVERALDQGALVETVSGDAAEELMAHGGMGAWVRY